MKKQKKYYTFSLIAVLLFTALVKLGTPSPAMAACFQINDWPGTDFDLNSSIDSISLTVPYTDALGNPQPTQNGTLYVLSGDIITGSATVSPNNPPGSVAINTLPIVNSWTFVKTPPVNPQKISLTSTPIVSNWTVTAKGLDTKGCASKDVVSVIVTPAPTLSISANPAVISLGQSSTITWSTTNAASCTASGAWSGNQSLGGSTVVTPGSAGTYNYTMTCQGLHGSNNSVTQTATLTVGAAPNGSITVDSRNYAQQQLAVSSNWLFGGPVDPCGIGPCSGTHQVYNGLALGTYTLSPSGHPTLYTFNSVKKIDAPTPTNSFLSLLSMIVNKAFAYIISPSPIQSLSVVNPSAGYIIFWNPVGAIDPTPSSLALNTGQMSGSITLNNTNGSPGSFVNNLSAIGLPSWITLSSLSGITLNQGAPGTPITVNATMPNGGCTTPCTATFKIQGITNDGVTVVSSPVITVTLTGTVTVSIAPQNPSVVVNATQQFNATVLGTGNQAVTWSIAPAGPGGSINAAGLYTAPTSPIVAQLTATSVQYPWASTSTSVTVVPAPSCSFTANPTTVVIPGSSKLNWHCIHTSNCSISPTVGSVVTTGHTNVSPTATTKYILSCTGVAPISTSVTVTVDTSNRIETNP